MRAAAACQRGCELLRRPDGPVVDRVPRRELGVRCGERLGEICRAAASAGCRRPPPRPRRGRPLRPSSSARRARVPRGRLPAPKASRCSSQSGTSATVTAPWAAHSAASACADPTTAPECASAAREAACERPLESTITGLPARAARASPSANAAGRRTVSSARPITVVARVGRERGEPVGSVAPDLVAARDDGAQPEARAGVQQRLAERTGVHDAGDAAAAQVVERDAADPGRRASRNGDAHAVRADQRHACTRAERCELGARDAAALAVLGPEPGHDEQRGCLVRSPRARRRRAAPAPIASAHTSGANGSSADARRRPGRPGAARPERWTATVTAPRLRFDQRSRPAPRSVAPTTAAVSRAERQREIGARVLASRGAAPAGVAARRARRHEVPEARAAAGRPRRAPRRAARARRVADAGCLEQRADLAQPREERTPRPRRAPSDRASPPRPRRRAAPSASSSDGASRSTSQVSASQRSPWSPSCGSAHASSMPGIVSRSMLWKCSTAASLRLSTPRW